MGCFSSLTHPILSLVAVTLLLGLSNVRTHTVGSLLEACFGSGFDHLAPKRVRAFGMIHAHSFRTGPEGIELVSRLRPHSCIYGFLFPSDRKVDHLLFNMNEIYIREGKDSYWESGIRAELKIFRYLRSNPSLLYNVSLKPPGQRIRETLFRVHRWQVGRGPVFVGLDHNVPRGINGLRYIHMNLIVTPVYTCNAKDSLINGERLTQESSKEHEEKEQNSTAEVESMAREQKFLVCSSETRNETATLNTNTTFCILAELMCDNFGNCPRNEKGLVLDEHINHCFKVNWFDISMSWIIPVVCVLVVTFCCVPPFWCYQKHRCRRCFTLLRKLGRPSSRTRHEPTETYPDFEPHPTSSDEELAYDYSRLASASGDPVPPCPSAPPFLFSSHLESPPPSYQEAMKVVMPDRPSALFISNSVNQTTRNSYYASSGCESGLESLEILAPVSTRTRVSPGPDPNLLRPPSYNQCVRQGSAGLWMNHSPEGHETSQGF